MDSTKNPSARSLRFSKEGYHVVVEGASNREA